MTKTTLQTIVYLPIFILIIYLVFFYKGGQIDKTKKNTNINNTINDTKMINENIKQISLEEFKKEMKKEDTILIDIRTPMEWERYGIIPGTDKYIVFGGPNFESEILNLDKEKKYLLYCFHGNRSDVARNYMQQLGFTWVKDLAGGINAFINAGEKVGRKED